MYFGKRLPRSISLIQTCKEKYICHKVMVCQCEWMVFNPPWNIISQTKQRKINVQWNHILINFERWPIYIVIALKVLSLFNNVFFLFFFLQVNIFCHLEIGFMYIKSAKGKLLSFFYSLSFINSDKATFCLCVTT